MIEMKAMAGDGAGEKKMMMGTGLKLKSGICTGQAASITWTP
jgi:hypothetical protein